MTVLLSFMHSWAMDDADVASDEEIVSTSEVSDSDSYHEGNTFFLHLSSPQFASFYCCMAGAYKGSVYDWARVRRAWLAIRKPKDQSCDDFAHPPHMAHKWCAIITKVIKQLDADHDVLIIEDTMKYGLIVKITTLHEISVRELSNMFKECDPLNAIFTDEERLDIHLEAHAAQLKDIEEYARGLRKTTKSRELQEKCMLDF